MTHIVQQTARDGLRHQNYEEIKSKITPEIQRKYPDEEKVPEAPEYGGEYHEYIPVLGEEEAPEIPEYGEEYIPVSGEKKRREDPTKGLRFQPFVKFVARN